jgi:hypothetical protein
MSLVKRKVQYIRNQQALDGDNSLIARKTSLNQSQVWFKMKVKTLSKQTMRKDPNITKLQNCGILDSGHSPKPLVYLHQSLDSWVHLFFALHKTWHWNHLLGVAFPSISGYITRIIWVLWFNVLSQLMVNQWKQLTLYLAMNTSSTAPPSSPGLQILQSHTPQQPLPGDILPPQFRWCPFRLCPSSDANVIFINP